MKKLNLNGLQTSQYNILCFRLCVEIVKWNEKISENKISFSIVLF